MSIYARGQARDWAKGKSAEEIRVEIAWCGARWSSKEPHPFLGNAQQMHVRIETLKAMLVTMDEEARAGDPLPSPGLPV